MIACHVRCRRVIFALVAAAGWFAVVTQFLLLCASLGPLGAALVCVSYFSIISNVLVAAAATAVAVRPDGRFIHSSGPAAVAVYITIVAVIWTLFLRGSYTVSGLSLVADMLMHEVMPPAYVAAWLVAVPKGALLSRHAAWWLILPLAYAAWMFARGAIDGWYPYPFLNVNTMGYPRAGGVTVAFVLLFWIVGMVYVAIDRLAARRAARSTSPASIS